MTYKPTTKQQEAQVLATSDCEHILFEGGSRSGKTFLHVRNTATRAIKSPKSRHAIVRLHFNDVKRSVVLDTFPKVMEICFPGVPYNINKTDWYASFMNGSEIWFGGLDDKERVEKILGNEYVTIYFNESSQLSNATRETVLTRLAQKCYQTIIVDGKKEQQELKPRAYYDANPPSKAHWLYKVFHMKVDPESKRGLKFPDDYCHILMNPKDNQENLTKSYLKTLESMSARRQKRFLLGQYSDENPNQLFSDISIENNRFMDELPDMVKMVVSVDPSGSGDEDNAMNDEIGIFVCGLGVDGYAYTIEDCTVKAGPKIWGDIATTAYDRHECDIIVGEKNFGGEMVRFVIQTSKPQVPFKFVTATRGKHVRAEPVAALCEQGKIRFAGVFDKLEDELQGFSTVGYIGENSPNRADAWIWAMSELFPGVVQPRKEVKKKPRPRARGSYMG